jgi:hypothetical protein
VFFEIAKEVFGLLWHTLCVVHVCDTLTMLCQLTWFGRHAFVLEVVLLSLMIIVYNNKEGLMCEQAFCFVALIGCMLFQLYLIRHSYLWLLLLCGLARRHLHEALYINWL